VPAIICPHCGEPTDNGKGRCQHCKKWIGIGNWSVRKFVNWTGRIVVLLALLVGGWQCSISFFSMCLRAKRSEAPTNLDAIRTAERSYHAEWGNYVALPYCPSTVAGRNVVDFDGPCAEPFEHLGWNAEGTVRCRYWVELVTLDTGEEDGFIAWAECDVDGDGEPCVYRATRDSKSRMLTPNSVW